MNEFEVNKLVDIINGDIPKEFEGYNVGKAMYYPLLYYKPKNLGLRLKMIFSPILIQNYQIVSSDENSKFLFFFGADYMKRKIYYDELRNVADLIPQSTTIDPYGKSKINLRNLLSIWRLLRWRKKIHVNDNNLKKYILYRYFEIYCEIKTLESLSKRGKYKCFISWCDVHQSDYIATEYFKKRNCITCTMQHGLFDSHVVDGKYAYINSPSDYFLCFGPVSHQCGIELGVSDKKMISVGMPEMIGMEFSKRLKKIDNKVMGVALSFSTKRDENENLLTTAKKLSDLFRLKVYIRPHPSLDMDEYKNFIEYDNFVLQKKEEGLKEFYEKVDFVTLGSSSVILTLAANLVPFFCYQKELTDGLFKSVGECSFADDKQLVELYKHYMEDSDWMEKILIQVRNSYIAEGRVEDNIKDFFEKVEHMDDK